jgi:hypothetical protein
VSQAPLAIERNLILTGGAGPGPDEGFCAPEKYDAVMFIYEIKKYRGGGITGWCRGVAK